MFYKHNPHIATDESTEDTSTFLLNLVDTPGHVNFIYEVSRSLAACQGVLLVVDAAQGVHAQTVANFYLAFESNLSIIPVINKIDQPTADPERVMSQLKSMFDLEPKDALLTSAKTGQGLEHILPAVIERIPPPLGKFGSPAVCSCWIPIMMNTKGSYAMSLLLTAHCAKVTRFHLWQVDKLMKLQMLGSCIQGLCLRECFSLGKWDIYVVTDLLACVLQKRQVMVIPCFKPVLL